MNSHKINYSVKSGLIELLIGSTGNRKEEVWANIADIAQVCANRLSKNKKNSSWTQSTYPETDVKIRIDMDKHALYCNETSGYPRPVIGYQYSARVKMANVGKWINFTSTEVEEYIEGVLLGEH